ncbi:MAG TPA: DUF5312 family protein, partial [Spirochaetota bacterium]|nr:DUF5312 family protein [Spirochaetota bacterium]
MERTEFEKLAKNLSEQERQELLAKLRMEDKTGNDGFDSTFLQKKGDKKLSTNEQYKIALEYYKKSGFLDKFLIMLASFFSGKNKEDLVIEKEFAKLKKEIQNKYYNILDFDNRLLTQNFANEIILLNEASSKIRDTIDNFFSDTEYYHRFLFDFFENQFGETLKKALTNLNPEDIKSTEFIDKTAFLRERERRIKEFFDVIDKAKFDFIINQVEKLEIALKILKFDYTKLLHPFGISNYNNLVTNKATVSFMTIEKSLEKFYSLLIDFNFSSLNIQILNDFVKFSKNNFISESREILNKSFTDQDVKKFYEVLNTFKTFLDKVPMDKIFKYCKKDILHNPMIKNETINVIEIYKEEKRKQVQNLWESHYINSKRGDLKKLIIDLFGENNFFTLHYFNENLYENIYKATNVKITSIYFINLLLFFIKKFYKHHIDTLLAKILIDGNFADDMSKFHLTGGYHTINNSIEKVNLFDSRFNPENDLGKKTKLYLERTSGINDPDLKKSFQNFCTEINDNGVSLSNEIITGLNTINNFFSKLSPSTAKSERPLINTESLKSIGHHSFQSLLEK